MNFAMQHGPAIGLLLAIGATIALTCGCACPQMRAATPIQHVKPAPKAQAAAPESEPDDRVRRRRAVVVTTEMFVLTEEVTLQPPDPDVTVNITYSDCLGPRDADGCCSVVISACPEDLQADCTAREAHGCWQ